MSQATSRQGFFGRPVAQLSTHHGGRQQAPVVVTYGAPLSVFQHLHSALAYDGPATEANQRLLDGKSGDTVKDCTVKRSNAKTTYLGFTGSFTIIESAESSDPKRFLLCDERVEAADWVASCLQSMLWMRSIH